MLTTTPLSSNRHRSYVRWDDASLDKLGAQADRLAERGCADTCELHATPSGISDQGDGPVLPLKLGDFRQALSEIENRDAWLTDRENVSCYRDQQGQIHLDVVNYGGFIVAGGHVVSRSVNAW